MTLHHGLSAIFCLAAGAAFAQETNSLQTTQLQEIVVSGGLSPIELRKSGRSISVISGEELEKNQVTYAVDALRLIPGVHVSRSGGTGSLTQIRLRGGETNQTLVVIDGITMNDVNDGNAYFENLLASDIEQIEVLRGPQSALWGSNAMSGVINITTKSGTAGKPISSVMTEAGTNKSWLTSLSTRGGSEAVRYALSGTFNRVNGFNIATIGDEDDQTRNRTINGKLSLDLNDATTLDTTLRWVDRKYDYDDSDTLGRAIDGTAFATEETLSGAISLTNKAFDDALTNRLNLSVRDQSNDFFDSYSSTSSTKRYVAGYNATYIYDEIEAQTHQLTAGYEWVREIYDASFMAGSVDRNSHSAIAEYRGEFDQRYSFTAGLRQDWNRGTEGATTWNVSGDWKLPDDETRIHSSIGTAVTKPTFVELFGYSSTFIGNPNLKPEKSFGWDIGIERVFYDGRVILDATYFNQNLTNEISGSGNSVINNNGESKRQGIELAAKLDFFNGFTTSASYTYTDATSQALATDPRLTSTRRPKHSASISTAYTFAEDKARIFAELMVNGAMVDESYAVGRVGLGGYTLVNIGGSYKVNETLDVFGRIENLFDKKYTEVYGYNTPGITAFAGLKASF